jgi:hypothetical protein
MIIYNETIIMDEAIYEEWLEWMQNVHIPLVMATGFFNAYRILKVVDSPNEGVTCCIQYNADTFGNYNQFYTEHLPMLQAIHQQRYENKFVLFNTVMESINEG